MVTSEIWTVPSTDEALHHAARLLKFAESETNLAVMERMEALADSWADIARLTFERERV